jgi:hypothetical protein
VRKHRRVYLEGLVCHRPGRAHKLVSFCLLTGHEWRKKVPIWEMYLNGIAAAGDGRGAEVHGSAR